MKSIIPFLSILFCSTVQPVQAQQASKDKVPLQDTTKKTLPESIPIVKKDNAYLHNVADLLASCRECGDINGLNMLIYDAQCRRFLYKHKNSSIPAFLDKLTAFRMYYKQPFQFKIINLNRYLYDVNLGNSDVTFTSNQSEIMRQYLLRGSSDSARAVPNTHSDGSSANMGDEIFRLIPLFKPELDKVSVLIADIRPDTAANVKVTTDLAKNMIQNYNNILPGRALIKEITTLNNYNLQLDQIANQLKSIREEIAKKSDTQEQSSIYQKRYIPAFEAFKKQANDIVDEIRSKSNKNSDYKKMVDEKFLLFESSVKKLDAGTNPYSGIVKSANTQPVIVKDTAVNLAANALGVQFRVLEKYYNDFIDDKINAYSICTDKFDCCQQDPKLTYTQFSNILSDITEKYVLLRIAAKRYELAMSATTPPATAPVAIGPVTPPKQPDIMKVTASDFTFDKDGKIIGIKLAQGGDAAKPEAKKVPEKAEILARVDSLGALWYAFEKAVSPEFMMRKILFRRNMVAQNMSYTSPPIYPFGDRMRLVFNIVASDSARKNGVILDDIVTESLDFRVREKLQFSFSAGTFVGFGNKLRTSTYEFRQVPVQGANVVEPGSPYQLVNTGKSSTPIGASALANVTTAICDGLRIGPSLGVGVSIAPDIKVAYLGGVTLSAGNYQQFHFSLGMTAMAVDQLKENFKNSNVLYTSAPAGSVYHESVKGGFFFSFSYTVFSVKASSNSQNGIVNRTGIMVK